MTPFHRTRLSGRESRAALRAWRELYGQPPPVPEKKRPNLGKGPGEEKQECLPLNYSASTASRRKSRAVSFYTREILSLDAVQIMFSLHPEWRPA